MASRAWRTALDLGHRQRSAAGPPSTDTPIRIGRLCRSSATTSSSTSSTPDPLALVDLPPLVDEADEGGGPRGGEVAVDGGSRPRCRGSRGGAGWSGRRGRSTSSSSSTRASSGPSWRRAVPASCTVTGAGRSSRRWSAGSGSARTGSAASARSRLSTKARGESERGVAEAVEHGRRRPDQLGDGDAGDLHLGEAGRPERRLERRSARPRGAWNGSPSRSHAHAVGVEGVVRVDLHREAAVAVEHDDRAGDPLRTGTALRLDEVDVVGPTARPASMPTRYGPPAPSRCRRATPCPGRRRRRWRAVLRQERAGAAVGRGPDRARRPSQTTTVWAATGHPVDELDRAADGLGVAHRPVRRLGGADVLAQRVPALVGLAVRVGDDEAGSACRTGVGVGAVAGPGRRRRAAGP